MSDMDLTVAFGQSQPVKAFKITKHNPTGSTHWLSAVPTESCDFSARRKAGLLEIEMVRPPAAEHEDVCAGQRFRSR